MNRWTRREVLNSLGRLPLLAGFGAVLAACGGGNDDGGGGGSSSSGGGSGTTACTATTPDLSYTISGSHTHDACLTQTELNEVGPITVTLTGSNHTHKINLTAAQLTDLRTTGVAFSVGSFDGPGHEHTVMFLG